MTSKECLKRIDEKNYLTEREHKEFLSVIEKDLDRLEELEKENQEANEIIKMCNHYISDLENERTKLKEENQELKSKNVALELWNDCYTKENTKLKNALEIIKNNYPVELKFTKHRDRNDNYNKYYLIVNHTLAVVEKEEYELLKEVLENDR